MRRRRSACSRICGGSTPRRRAEIPSSGSAAPAEAWKRSMSAYPHRRFNPLRREWVLVSPRRNDRPWQGQVDAAARPIVGPHDPSCYLCPGNARAGGVRNPGYTTTFAFDNDFPALVAADEPSGRSAEGAKAELFATERERGIYRVICFSPRHDLTLSRMDAAAIRAVIDTWI